MLLEHLFRESETITEGLIKIPPKLLDGIMDYVRENALWMIRSKFTTAARQQYPEHFAAFRQQVTKHGFKLPRTKFPMPEKGFSLTKWRLRGEALPDNYPKISEEESTFILLLNWENKLQHLTGKKTMAAWWSEKNVLMVNIYKIDLLNRFPSQQTHAGDLEHAFAAIEESVAHELRHVIQSKMFKNVDPRQVEKRPDYAKHGTDYFASRIEFDPQIGTAVAEFIDGVIISKSANKKVNFAKAIKTFVAAKPSSSFEIFAAYPVFKALKKVDPERYNLAVKKFYVALQDELDKKELREPSRSPSEA
jgi:hypothetical protein